MKEVYVRNRREWREWLVKNHDQETGIWLVFYKKGASQPTLEYEDSVEEALCFGWIDSIIKNIDEEKYVRKFSPRKPDSRWSALNKSRVEKMIRAGRMTPLGLNKIKAAQKSGAWEKHERPRLSFKMPAEFKKALEDNPKAKDCFKNLAPTYQKQYLGWLEVAKRRETKKKRIKESISLLLKGKKLGLK